MRQHKLNGVRELSGQVIGCSVREETQVRVAVLDVAGDRIRSCQVLAFMSPHMLAGHFVERPRPLGVGLAATLAVGTGREGWRAADYWIDAAPHHRRSEYDEFPFYWGPFQLDGGGSLAAFAIVSLLRRRWPDLPVNEADPRSCCYHLARCPEWPDLASRTASLATWLGVPLPPDLSEGGWSAVMTAYASWMGLRGAWTIDLHRLTRPASEAWEASSGPNGWTEETYVRPALSFETLVFPAGPATFFWPPDERAELVDPLTEA
jgi:hypothetical protein